MLTPGTPVRTPLGKGVVREVRNGGRVLVEIRERATEFALRDVAADADARTARSPATPAAEPARASATRRARAEIDLHGLTVEEAVTRVDEALNDALLAGLSALRVIHGRSGGRLRAALHRRLREIPSVRGFRVDPRNEGVTEIAL